ncbi:MAG TPA: ADOP family duplicated permease, partial [Vicinamibacterales bacterium]|nr:ADOP family duplicated permease [Vicinamibacterales bacterium]
GMVLRPLPVPRASEVVTINSTAPDDNGRPIGLSYLAYQDLRKTARSFDSMGAHRVLIASFALRREDQAESRLGFAVSGNIFDVLEVRPEVGRFFRPDEDQVPERDAVAVISHDTWTQAFNKDPGVVGRELRLNGVPFTVIGVAPASFTGLELVLPGAFYVPLNMIPKLSPPAQANVLDLRVARMLNVKARVRPGVPLAQARAEVRQIGQTWQLAYPADEQNRGLILRTHFEARQVERGFAATVVAMMLMMALVVLLVACANVAGLLTSRAPARAREIAVRLAMGAGRLRLVRQLLTEALLIATGGGLTGIALAYGVISLFQRRTLISDIGVKVDFHTDRRVIAVALAVSAVSALAAGLIPAFRSARAGDLSGTLRNGSETGTRGRLWGRHTLVAGQVALALALVTVGVFLYQTFSAELRRGPGFRTERLLLVDLDATFARYDGARAIQFYEQLKDRARAVAGVSSVALSSFIPLNQDYRDRAFLVPEGFQLPKGVENLTILASRVDEGYFDTMRVRLVAGRGFLATDTTDAPGVVIVNETMAAKYWPGQQAVGKRVRFADGTWRQVVGVAADTKYNTITETPLDFVYLAARQDPAIRTTLLVGVTGASASVAAPVREAVRSLDRDVPITGVWTMEEFYNGNAATLTTYLTGVVGGMGLVGLALAMVGLYGLVAYTVSRRTREIGIRMAIGAQPGSVLRMVMRQGAVLVAVGAAVGLGLTVAVSGALRGAFPSTHGANLGIYALVVPILLVVTLLAALLPALRAARIDPLAALRQD